MNYTKSVLTISISPSLIIQVSNLQGLFETLINLTFIGAYSSSSDSSPLSSGGQGSSLQGLVKIASPLQGSPSSVKGGIHFYYKVIVPPPHLRVQEDQSYTGTQYPSA